jgi:hypothetical protein
LRWHLSLPQAGFGHDYDCVSQDVPAYDHLIRVLPRCFTEVMLRVANPIRPQFPTMFKYGRKGSAAFVAFQKEMAKLLDNLQVRADGPVSAVLCCVLLFTHCPESLFLAPQMDDAHLECGSRGTGAHFIAPCLLGDTERVEWALAAGFVAGCRREVVLVRFVHADWKSTECFPAGPYCIAQHAAKHQASHIRTPCV